MMKDVLVEGQDLLMLGAGGFEVRLEEVKLGEVVVVDGDPPQDKAYSAHSW